MSISKDSSFAHFAAVAGEKYKVALQHAQWAFSVDWCISSLPFITALRVWFL